MHLAEARHRLRWWFMVYRIAYGKAQHGPPEQQWLVQIMGRRFVVRYCAKAEGGW